MPTTACERCSTPLPSRSAACGACLDEGRRQHDPWLGRVLDERYRVLRRVSSGGQGSVHEVLCLDDGVRRALKSQHVTPLETDAAIDRFLREARAMLRLRHPSIAAVHDVGQVDGVGAYIVLEFIEGTTVRSLLAEGPLPVARTLEVATDVADALDSAHGVGVVHRDLKPENVVVLATRVAGGPSAKLIDFGIARISEAVSITAPTHVLGTPGYMAPEYVRDACATPASDQYSLGVLVYEMISGRLPFDGTSVGTMLVRQATTDPLALSVRVPDVDPALEAVVMRALRREPADRFRSMSELRGELRRFAQEQGSPG